MLHKDIDMEHQGEIILYQPDEAVKLEVRLEDETVWLTQAQIAELFGTEVPAISKHIRNIISCALMLLTATCCFELLQFLQLFPKWK